jgi:hypothetical protein
VGQGGEGGGREIATAWARGSGRGEAGNNFYGDCVSMADPLCERHICYLTC